MPEKVEKPRKTRYRQNVSNMNRSCARCSAIKPATAAYFGHTPSGGLKGFCRECEKKASREYEAKNKERRRVRDAKRAEATGGTRRAAPLKLKQELYSKQGGRCICCFKLMDSPEIGEVDHGRPLVRGGKDDRSNMFLVHAQCNREKHNKTLPEHWEWRVKVGFDDENLGMKHGLLDRV